MNTNRLPPVIIYSGELTLEQLWAFPSFVSWMDTLDRYASSGCRVEWIHVYGGTLFGLHHVQSLFVDARVVDVEGAVVAPAASELTCKIEPSLIPCAGMLRSDTTGTLFLFTDAQTRETFILLTKQERALVGKPITELPTGIIDGHGWFCGAQADKIARILGKRVNITELQPLNPRPTHSACALVDQGIRYFLHERTLSHAQMLALSLAATPVSNATGELEILVTPFDMDKLPTDDGKLWSAIGLISRARPGLLLEYGLVPMPSI